MTIEPLSRPPQGPSPSPVELLLAAGVLLLIVAVLIWGPR